MYRAIFLSTTLATLILGATPAWCGDTLDRIGTSGGGIGAHTPADPIKARIQARVSLNAGNGAAALSSLEQAIQAGVAPEEVLELHAEAMLLLKQFRRVLDEIDAETAVGDYQRSQVLGLRGEAHLALGEFEHASQTLRDALVLAPRSTRVLLAQAVLAKAQDDPAGALERIEQALQSDPHSSRAFQLKGELLYLQRNFSAAEQAFTQAVLRTRSPTMARFRRAMARLELGDLEGGTADIAAVTKAAPRFAGIKLASARLALARKDPQTTLAEVELYLTAKPDDAQGIYLASVAAMQLERYALAEQYLLRLNELVPEHDGYVRLLARARLRQGLSAAAQATIAPIVANKAPTPELVTLQTDIFRAQGRHDQADKILQQLPKASPEMVPEDLQQAAELAAARKYTAAIDELDQLLSREPNRTDARLLRLESMIGAERGDEALSEARILMQQNPDEVNHQLALGAALRATGDVAAAKSVFTKLLAASPDLAPANRQLAQIALQESNEEIARKHLDRLLTGESAYYTWALLNLIRLDLAAGETDTAVQRLSAALEKAPNSLALRVALARTRLVTNNAAEALRILQDAPDDQSANPALLTTKGLVELAADQPKSAMASFEQLVERQPSSASAHAWLARASAAAGNAAQAEEELTTAIRLDREQTLTTALLDSVIRQLGGTDHGTALLERLQTIKPEHRTIAVLRGQATQSSGIYAEAEKLFDQWSTLAGGDSRFTEGLIRAQLSQQKTSIAAVAGQTWLAAHPDAFSAEVAMLTADAHLHLNQTDAAASLYLQVIEHNPNHATALNNLAFLRKDASAIEALEYAERAVSLQPDSASFLDTLGTVLIENGRSERAIPHLAKAHELIPADPGITYRYARALAETGNEEQARRLLLQLGDGGFPERAAADELLEEFSKNPR